MTVLWRCMGVGVRSEWDGAQKVRWHSSKATSQMVYKLCLHVDGECRLVITWYTDSHCTSAFRSSGQPVRGGSQRTVTYEPQRQRSRSRRVRSGSFLDQRFRLFLQICVAFDVAALVSTLAIAYVVTSKLTSLTLEVDKD